MEPHISHIGAITGLLRKFVVGEEELRENVRPMRANVVGRLILCGLPLMRMWTVLELVKV
jgi:hypothetical protein